jgi:trehalose-6-phosphate hydrolase
LAEFKNKVVYQIYLRSFCDSNSDGIGDLKGITGKLDYLKNLDIDYIWITPFFLSPQRDNGYDIENYLCIDPRFGIMQDLEELIVEAGKRQIGIMLDMVFNHTSTAHEWFQRAVKGEKEYEDYYIFKEGSPEESPTNWQSKFGGPSWEYVPELKKWYLHLFDVTQADLNWENPRVRQELKEIICFWKAKGISGFRFDVVNLISKPRVYQDDLTGDGRLFYTDGPRVHEYLKELVRDTGIQDLVTVGEMSSTTLENCIRYSDAEEKELSMCFNFHHLKVDYMDGNKWRIKEPDIQKLKMIIEEWQMGMQKHNGWNALFWCNHDQPRIVSRFGDDKRYWKESAKMLATFIHMLRGTPYIYQGEEIGMKNACYESIDSYRDVESRNYYEILKNQGYTEAEALKILSARSRDNGRTPMQWTDEEYVGFSGTAPWIHIPSYGRIANVSVEEMEEDSILEFYKRLIRLRKKEKVISHGNICFLDIKTPEIIAYIRYLPEEQKSGEVWLVLNNFSAEEKTAYLDSKFQLHNKIIGNYSEMKMIENKDRPGVILLRPFETMVLRGIMDIIPKPDC